MRALRCATTNKYMLCDNVMKYRSIDLSSECGIEMDWFFFEDCDNGLDVCNCSGKSGFFVAARRN